MDEGIVVRKGLHIAMVRVRGATSAGRHLNLTICLCKVSVMQARPLAVDVLFAFEHAQIQEYRQVRLSSRVGTSGVASTFDRSCFR